MPLPFGIPVGLLVGLTLAWLARHELTRSEVPLVLVRPFLIVVGFAALVFAPVLAYFAALHGDWAYLYLLPWSRVPSAIDFAAVLLIAACVPLGFAIGTPIATSRRYALFSRLTGAIVVLTIFACVIASRRLTVSATYSQYHAGFGLVPIGQSSLGRGVLLSWFSLAAAYAWTVRVLRSPQAGVPRH